MEDDFQAILERLRNSISMEKAKGIDAIIQVNIEGRGDYILTIRDQKLNIETGKAVAPRMTLRAKEGDLVAIFERKLDPTVAFFQGKLSVQGDMNLAMQLPGLFK